MNSDVFQADQPQLEVTIQNVSRFSGLERFKWTTKPGWSSRPGGRLSELWWRLCQVNMHFTPPPHASPPLRRKSLDLYLHISPERSNKEEKSRERRREPKPGRRAGLWRRWQQQRWSEVCEWQKDPSSTFPFLASLEVKATPSGHWLHEPLWLGWEKIEAASYTHTESPSLPHCVCVCVTSI